MAQERKEKRRPDLDTVYSINEDGSRNAIYPADVKGRWQKRLWIVWYSLLLIYAGLPWLQIGGHPAVHIDLPARQAYLFGSSYSNQDFYLMFFVLSGLGFALFVVTALWGRIFCGFVCPQSLFMEGIFRRLERRLEGPRPTRIRRDSGSASFDKIWRKGIKHFLFLSLSGLSALIFVSYFIPARELAGLVLSGPSGHMTAFIWSLSWTGILYFDCSWFREQTCLIICPYGRLQSALIDPDTIVIGYDSQRGEPRGTKAENTGDCIACYRCVEVCPTGIDIRNGLQMECVGCTRCVDACDEIMRKTKRPEGLIRFDSQRGFSGEGRRSLFRLRVFIYFLFGFLGLVIALWIGGGREEFQANILRAQGMPYAIEQERIKNLFNLHIQNKSGGRVLYKIRFDDGMEDLFEIILPQKEIQLDAGEDQELPIFVYMSLDAYQESIPLALTLFDTSSGKEKRIEVMFRGPKQ